LSFPEAGLSSVVVIALTAEEDEKNMNDFETPSSKEYLTTETE
jgi:hypothetical protein